MRSDYAILAVLVLSATSGPAHAACYVLELKNTQSGQPRREAEVCAESEIEARRQCRRLAERRNDGLPSREPLRFYCREAG